MKKTLIGVLISLCLLSVSFFAFACDEKEEEKDLTVSKTEIILEKYGHGFLTASYGGDDSLEFVWKSNDESIVEVVDGQLTGKSEGETVVSASYGNKTAECQVKVTAPDANKLSLDAGNDLDLYINDVIQLEPTLRYSNIPINGVKYGYNSSDDKTVTVDANGKITAVAMGNAFISVECEAEGKKFTKVVSVSVEQEYSVEIEQRNVALYPVSEYKGQTYTNQMEFTSVVKKRGAEIKADGVEWTCEVGQNIIELVGNKATAKNVGETKITAKYSGEFGVVSDEVTVKVNPIDVTLDGVTVDLSVIGDYEPDKDAKIKDIIDEDVLSLIVKIAGIDECTFKVNEGKVNFGLNENVKSGNATVKYVTNKFSYTVDAVFYDLLIDSPEDLEFLSADVKFAKLVNDIDMKDYGTWTSTVDFFGTFDGGGYAIKNLTASGSGLFKDVNGTVKDLALIDVTTIGSTGALAYSYLRTGVGSLTVENVVITYKTAITGWLASGLFRMLNVSSPVVLKNLLVYIPATTNSSCGYISGKVSGVVTVENCLFVGGYQEQLTYSGDDWVPTIKGNDGELAVKGEDYFTYSDLDVFAEDYQSGKIISTEMVEAYAELLISKQITLINSSNVADLLTATSGNYMLTEDIDMATAYTANGGVWTSTAEFTGTLDGAGHKIKNLTTSGSGLFKSFNGTIKNIAFLDAVQNSNNTGLIANDYNRTGLAVTVENVVANFKTANTGWQSGGLFMALNISSNVTLKNVFVNVNTTSNEGDGLIAFKISGPVTLDNCCFIGYGEKLDYGYQWVASYKGTDGADAVKGEDYYTYADLMTFIENGYSSFSPSTFVKGVIDEIVGASVTLINSSNVADLLTATSGNYMLTEDIDMATAYTANGGVWTSTATFSGMFNGAGHKIKNLTTSGSGLFKSFNGTIKNIAFLDAVQNSNNTGLIANDYNRTGLAVTVENVVANFKTANTGWQSGGLFMALNISSNVTLKNVFVNVNTTSNEGDGLIAFKISGPVTLDNCCFIGYGEKLDYGYQWVASYKGTDGADAVKGEDYFTYADIESFKTEYEKTESEISLTDFVKGVVGEIIK